MLKQGSSDRDDRRRNSPVQRWGGVERRGEERLRGHDRGEKTNGKSSLIAPSQIPHAFMKCLRFHLVSKHICVPYLLRWLDTHWLLETPLLSCFVRFIFYEIIWHLGGPLPSHKENRTQSLAHISFWFGDNCSNSNRHLVVQN